MQRLDGKEDNTMSLAYHEAQKIIKHHVNACDNDILITSGAGM